jgi:outer membrane protein TolC
MTKYIVMKKQILNKQLSALCVRLVPFVVNLLPQSTQRFTRRTQRKFAVLIIISMLSIVIDTKGQTLDDYLKIAAQNNPGVKAQYQSYYAALEKVPQAGSLPDPQLSFSMFIGRDGLFMERLMGEQLTELSVMQMFPWAGSLAAAKDEATYMAQMQFAAFQESKINLNHEVRSAWYNLYRIDKELVLLNEEKEILKTYEQLALTRFKTGTSGVSGNNAPAQGASSTQQNTSASGGMSMGGSNQPATSANSPSMNTGMSGGSSGSMVDVLLVQLQIKELDTRITLLKSSRKPQEIKFNNLLNRSVNESIVIADTLLSANLPAMLSIIRDSVIQNHPMVKMFAWDEKVRETQQRMATLMGRPMIGVGLAYMVFRPRYDELMNVNMGGENMFMPMVTVSLPIYRKKYNAQRKEAEYYQQAARYNKESVQLDLMNELENLLYDYESSLQRLSLLNDQLEITQQAIRLMITSYSTGTMGMEEILRQRQSLLSYQQQQLNALTEQHITISSIKKLMGVDIN